VKGESVSFELPLRFNPRKVVARVKDVGHFARPGLWARFRKSTATVVLSPA
jgi:hypothetical protein